MHLLELLKAIKEKDKICVTPQTFNVTARQIRNQAKK
jgi:hypothetical protein